MLIFCYGVTKSGSTLAFELIKGMLATAGHAQERLPDGVVNPGHRVNYVQPLDRKRLNNLLAAVGERWIAVKTHAGIGDPLFAYLEQLQRENRVQVVISCRDPRDICLSLVDAGETARATGRKEFSEITDLSTAVPGLQQQIEKFEKWSAIRGALLLDYDTVAFETDTAIDRIESCLGIRSDRESAKRYAFEEAFTQKNKGQRNRFREELTAEQNAELVQAFAAMIANFSEGDPTAWIAERRAEILDRLEQARAASRG
jgi:hypothetical protein